MLLKTLFLILTCAISNANTYSPKTDHSIQLLKEGLEQYIKHDNSTKLNETFGVLQFPGLFQKSLSGRASNKAFCATCNAVIGAIIAARRLGFSAEFLGQLATAVCIGLKIQTDRVCRAAVETHQDLFVYIIDEKKYVRTQRVCSILFQNSGCVDGDRTDWKVPLPPKPSQEKRGNGNVTKVEPLKILHISDIHLDPGYTVGSNANCDEPICCQPGSVPEKEEDVAGYWGDYRGCDTSNWAFIDALNHIVLQHKDLDYVYFIGDIIDHRVWNINVKRNSKIISAVLREFKNTFGDVPVFPILGNHESVPVHVFTTEEVEGLNFSSQWIFDLSAKEWLTWLPENTKETILKGGYYTVLIKPGFRVIALNSNVCFTYNWWLLYEDDDPFDQLKWLVEVLLEAENKKEKVHIISHVPTADDTCFYNWGKEYSKIITRFSDTIVAQFNGHTHYKENIIYYENNDLNKPINVAFNGGSLTAWRNVNPNYVVYDVNPSTSEIEDYQLWIYNITEANINPQLSPRWFKLYSFKDAYKTNSLNSAAMGNLVTSLAQDSNLRDQYFRFKYRNSDPMMKRGCNKDCHLSNLCYMVTSYYKDTKRCELLEEMWVD